MNITEETKTNAQTVVDFITMNPQRHDQSSFEAPDPVCGTVHCVAGWTVALLADQNTLNAVRTRGAWVTAARDLLGLEVDEAETLFYEIQAESFALDALRAVAAGDETKFEEVADSYWRSEVDTPVDV